MKCWNYSFKLFIAGCEREYLQQQPGGGCSNIGCSGSLQRRHHPVGSPGPAVTSEFTPNMSKDFGFPRGFYSMILSCAKTLFSHIRQDYSNLSKYFNND